MNSKGSRAIFGLLVGVAALIVIVVVGLRAISGLLDGGNANFSKPQNAVEIKVVYAPELDLYMRDVITDFNRSYAQGRNPVTGKELARGEKPIWVTGGPGSSGTVAQGIINAVIAPNNANVERPTLFAPSVRHWLALVNYQTGQSVFDVNGAPATAVAPVVMAIWESRLEAIKSRNPGKEIGWQELFQVINSPNGWRDYGLSGRQAVYYGHTDPFVSSTALSTLMAEFYASARYNAGNVSASKLTQDQANDPKVLEGVRQFERLIKHYSARTTEFKEYIAQGPEYLDFVALEENDLIFINQGKTQAKPTEKLVALYPKEGTFVHDHPFAVPNANWVTEEQRAAARVFTEFNLTRDVQLKVLENGFRPANPQVPIGFPITAENGVDPSQPKTLLPVPDPAVLATVQNSWQLVKKQASVVLLVDTSGSMGESDKIGQARGAARVFLEDQGGKNNISLVEFNTAVRTLVPMASLEQNRGDLNTRIDGLRASGNTALYDALLASIDQLQKNSDSNRIQAIVLLSDGQDTSSKATVNDVVRAIQVARNGRAPILVIPVAYGKDADINALNAIARASDTKVQSGDANTIKRLLEVIGSYF